jgi:glycosyltransferase involved in cell wall biosynthesis
MMKILHVTQGYAPAIGGTEWMMQQISEELVHRYADQVTVFTSNCLSAEAFRDPRLPRMPVGSEEINGVQVRRFPVANRLSRLLRWPQSLAYFFDLPGNQYLRAWMGGPILPGLSAAICHHSCEVVAAASFPLLHMFTALKAAHKVGKPCVLLGGLHPDDRWGYDRPMIYRAIQQADGYIAYTDFEASYVIRRGANPLKISTIGMGVHPVLFDNIDSTEAKARLGISDRPVVGYIGQLGGHKGVDTLLRAMLVVWDGFPDVTLLIAGARTQFAPELDRLLRRYTPEQRRQVVWLENFPEAQKPCLFAAVDCFVYPSGYESFGIAFLEAWSAGKPVISCRRGAIPSVVDAGKNGLLVPYQHPSLLAEAILLMLRNPTWARALGLAGREKVLANHTWEKITTRIRKTYQSVLEN